MRSHIGDNPIWKAPIVIGKIYNQIITFHIWHPAITLKCENQKWRKNELSSAKRTNSFTPFFRKQLLAYAILSIMINWQSVIFNSFWIVGLATLLAAFSYSYWLAEQEGRRLRTQLGGIGFQRTLWLSLVLIGIGLAGTSRNIWEIVIWGILILIALVSLLTSNKT
jgi:hypothetical protein